MHAMTTQPQPTTERRPTKAECVQRAAEVLVEDLFRQAERPDREAALASLGPRATEEQIAAWIERHRGPLADSS